MIYLFAGDDSTKKLKALEVFLRSQKKGIETFTISKNDFDRMYLESLYSSAGLFFVNSLVVLSGVLEREEDKDFILDNLNKMSESQSIFVFSENKLKKPVIDAFKKARAEINIFEMVKGTKETFNNFLLANALGDRSKLNLWIYFRQAIREGSPMEALIGILHWKVKDMILKKNFQKFTEKELQNMDMKFSYLLPEARKNHQDDEAFFEKFLLEAF